MYMDSLDADFAYAGIDKLREEAERWQSAYEALFAANERHIAELETANAIIDTALAIARKNQDEVERLKAVIRRSQTPVFPQREMDDDALWDEV
jgi:hypothetical protein